MSFQALAKKLSAIRSPLMLAGVFLLLGCDGNLDEHTRPGDALLTQAELKLAKETGGAMLESSQTNSSCEQMGRVLGDLEALAKGQLEFPGNGVMDINRVVWNNLAQAQRASLLDLLVVQNKCATGSDNGVAVARDMATKVILLRYKG